MGSGSSTSGVLSRDKELVEAREHRRAVNKFLMKAYCRCSRAEAVVMLLSNNTGLKHFSHFIVDQRETGYLDLFLELKGAQTTANTSVYYFQQLMRRIVEEYIHAESHRYIRIPSHLIRDIEQILSRDFDKPIAHIMAVIEQLQDEMVALMARDQFPGFLSSKFYQNWQAHERDLSTTSAKATLHAILKDHNGAQTNSTRSVHECSLVEDSTLADSVLAKKAALETILRHAGWLSTLISAVELLPISFLLCQVATKEQGEIPRFPVLFANKYVEKSFGFQRKALIGKPYDALLRCAETKKEDGGAAAELEAMTQQYQAASAVVTHANSTGVPFKNLVATKPLFDHSGTCVYVIYLMFTLSVCSCSSSNSSCSGVDAAINPRGRSDSTNTTTSTLHQSSAIVPCAHQNSSLIPPVDRIAEERIKAEKLLHILPKYVVLKKVAIPPPPPAAEASPGCLESALGQLGSFRLFYNRVQPTGVDAEKSRSVGADAGGGQEGQDQPMCPSIREAQLSAA